MDGIEPRTDADTTPGPAPLLKQRSHMMRLLRGLLAISLAAACLWWWLVCHQPSFWIRAAERVCMYNHAKLDRLAKKLEAMKVQIRSQGRFELVLREDEITAWFRELEQDHYDRVPGGITWILLAARQGNFRIGFQDRSGLGQPVIWMVMKPRLVDGSTVELRLENIHRGLLPASAAELQEYFSGVDWPLDLNVYWKQLAEDNGIVELSLPERLARQIELRRVESQPDKFVLHGTRRNDSSPSVSDL